MRLRLPTPTLAQNKILFLKRPHDLSQLSWDSAQRLMHLTVHPGPIIHDLALTHLMERVLGSCYATGYRATLVAR